MKKPSLCLRIAAAPLALMFVLSNGEDQQARAEHHAELTTRDARGKFLGHYCRVSSSSSTCGGRPS